VRTSRAGLCRSDLHMIDGISPATVPVVMGNEYAGIVEDVGDELTYVNRATT
jgi:Zn-dependent alcohol dehydrogenase